MSTENKDLFKQIRTAHRLVVAYYKRLHQVLSSVGKELKMEFFVWEPSEYGRPSRRTGKILESWAWDMAPGIVTEYVFRKASSDKEQKLGDWLLVLHVISDTAVTNQALIGDVDPLELSPSAEDAQSVLRCYLVAPRKNLNEYWYENIWVRVRKKIECTDSPEVQSLDGDNEVYGAGFEMDLAELCLENLSLDEPPAVLIKKIGEYRDVLLEVQKTVGVPL